MQENKSHLLNYAMYAGIFLGGFWALRYLLVIFGFGNPMVSGMNTLLGIIGTPALLFYFLKNYNEKFLNNTIRLWHGVQFTIVLFFFASILEALMVLLHVIWIDPNFISMRHEAMLAMAETLNLGTAMTSQLAEQPQLTPFTYVFGNVLMVNTLIGLILSLIIVPIVQRFKIVRNEQ
jgi:hypothetical protein